ncbi:Rieske (2Fe-2S) protein [Natronomonas gomsonensis]|uniref:Rieske (2Fe-2S) protein n=1 Tax=Natronomonas gomsonensis TaxID=1046043 RepID=UPI0015BB8A2E|nr:Rieske (2Fe-2S) protein [Natronomonas gomsonensis]
MGTESYVPVCDLADLEAEGRTVVSEDGRTIALFYHEKEIYAVDNRCPHMGFPLVEGTVDEGMLTCHWHHARFELEEGDTFDPWADDVQTFPVELRDGQVFLDPDPEPTVEPATRWRNRLADGLQEDIPLVMAKATIGLDEEGMGFETPLRTAVDFGTKYRASGWGRGLTTLSYMAELYPQVAGRDKRRAMFTGVREVADDVAGEAPRFQQYAFRNRDLSKSRLKSWFRENCEVRDADGAERTLLTAIDALSPDEVVEMLVATATDHLYMDASHTLDFLNSALSTLDHLGWDEHAPAVLASTVPRFTDGTRSEELSSWRQPVDIAALCFDAHDRLDDLVAAGRNREWTEPNGFVETLLTDDPETILEALCDAIADGATQQELADAVARAATRRVAYFATNNEFGDWDTVHHTFVYANAAHELAARTDATELYRACFDGAMSVYLDRFLNSPRAPVPDADGGRAPEAIRSEILDALDEQGGVNRTARLVVEHFESDGDPADLKRVLGRGLLREDADFHTLQNVGAAFRRFDALEAPDERRLAMVAAARYLAAHTPTRREFEGTFSIATRLHRGERLHEAE